MPALIFIGIVVIGVAIWQILPEKEVYLAPKIENSIAVISFENQTGDEAYDYLERGIPNLLITNLENTGLLYVATWERMSDILKQMGKADVDVIDRDLGFELCRREGIESIVVGSFIKAGQVFATDIKVLDVESKKLLKSANTRGKDVDSILETQIDELSREISIGIGLAREKIEAAQMKIADVTTSSMEAYKFYLKGKEKYLNMEYPEALPFFEKAVELDPTFAMAHRWRAASLYNVDVDWETVKEAYNKGMALSAKASEKERLYIEGNYAGVIEGDLEKRLRIYKEYVKKYPKDKEGYLQLGMSYGHFRMDDEAIKCFDKALELDTKFMFAYEGAIFNSLFSSNPEKTWEYCERYESAFPGNPGPMITTAWAYWSSNRLDEAMLKCKEALEIDPDFLWAYYALSLFYINKEDYIEAMTWTDKFIASAPPGINTIGYISQAIYHYWQGHTGLSDSFLEKAEQNVGEARGQFAIEVICATELLRGFINMDRSEFEKSRHHFNNCLDYSHTLAWAQPSFYKSMHAFSLGLLELKQGKIEAAEKKLAEMRSLKDDVIMFSGRITYYEDYLSAEIFLAENATEKAIPILEKTSLLDKLYFWDIGGYSSVFYNLPFEKDGLARAYQQNGELDKAISEYERLIAFLPDKKDNFWIHPVYHYRLAKLYEETGQTANAIAEYEKFLDLWKDADPGISEVEDAKIRLTILKTQ